MRRIPKLGVVLPCFFHDNALSTDQKPSPPSDHLSLFIPTMRPLLNKDFRRLRWLLRQKPPKPVQSSSASSMWHSFRWLISCTDYLIREVVSLTKGAIDPRILSAFRASLPMAELKMAHVIAVLCFVSRMRLRDRGGTNAIPVTHEISTSLHKLFNSAAYYGLVGDQSRSFHVVVWTDLLGT